MNILHLLSPVVDSKNVMTWVVNMRGLFKIMSLMCSHKGVQFFLSPYIYIYIEREREMLYSHNTTIRIHIQIYAET